MGRRTEEARFDRSDYVFVVKALDTEAFLQLDLWTPSADSDQRRDDPPLHVIRSQLAQEFLGVTAKVGLGGQGSVVVQQPHADWTNREVIERQAVNGPVHAAESLRYVTLNRIFSTEKLYRIPMAREVARPRLKLLEIYAGPTVADTQNSREARPAAPPLPDLNPRWRVVTATQGDGVNKVRGPSRNETLIRQEAFRLTPAHWLEVKEEWSCLGRPHIGSPPAPASSKTRLAKRDSSRRVIPTLLRVARSRSTAAHGKETKLCRVATMVRTSRPR